MRGIYRLNPFLELPICDDNYIESDHGTIPCYDFRRKIIALRVYFVLVIINFFFITITTGYFIYRNFLAHWNNTTFDKSLTTPQDISRQWQAYSLKKRGLFGTTLGAFGHLIFSTTVLLYQVIVTNFTCDIYLWGPVVGFYIWTYAIVWRAYRLHFLIRVNELRQKISKKKSIRFSDKESYINNSKTKPEAKPNTKEEKDYKWFMRHKDTSNMGLYYQASYFCGSLVIIFLIITLAETLGIWVNNTSVCEFYMGNYMVLAMVIFFFTIIVPFIFWYLRDDGDAHGIRTEIWVSMAVAVPCFIMCIIWQVLFEYPSDSKPAGLRGVFGPSNWLIIVTTTYHVMSVVLPVFKTLSINTNKKKKDRTGSGEKTCCHRKSSAVSINTISRALHLKHKNECAASLQDNNCNDKFHWELTVDSLNAALNDPATLNVLKNWAIKDFSVENILFYDRYLQLAHQANRSSHFITETNTKEQKLTHPIDPVDSNCESCYDTFDLKSSTLSTKSELLFDTPLSFDQIPDLLDFYYTFITDQSPLQVNISYKARSEIDSALAPLAKDIGKPIMTQSQMPQSGIPQFLQSSVALEEALVESVAIFPNTENIHNFSDVTPSCSSSPDLHGGKESELYSLGDYGHISANISLQVLENARKEVFWNIFTGLFPRVVEAYNTNCNH